MSLTWNKIASVSLDEYVLTQNFFNGLKVLIERPHVINTKLLAAEISTTEDIPFISDVLVEYLNDRDFCQNSLKNILKNIHTSNKPYIKNKEENHGQVIYRSVIPKRVDLFKEVFEIVLIDFLEESVSFFPKKSDVLHSPIVPSFPYKFRLTDQEIQLTMLCISENKSKVTIKTEKWLCTKVLPKVSKWCQTVPKHPVIQSLQLVPAKNYNEALYNLKKKYAKKFVKIWPMYNTTDPIKYVYEDLSIAAYLTTLWAEERKLLNVTEKQTFIDLGCGHGLLDHILQSEGHKGIGYDLRKRKIWDLYGEETKLIEKVIEPNEKQLYANYDWMIGNHPDELTPWIPVIASRSSYKMRVFLLPCCFYTFDGKYIRSRQDYTQYQSYLNFLKLLCDTMGFSTQIDRLRIPSTKRTCLVGTSRTYEEKEEAQLELIRRDFISSYSKYTKKSLMGDQQILIINTESVKTESKSSVNNCNAHFIPREANECVRNCTTLDKNIIHCVVMTIVNALLKTENHIALHWKEKTILWNKGGI